MVYAYLNGWFTSQEAMQETLTGFGSWAASVFVIIQAIGVVIPINPGGLGCVVGVLMFGPWRGFVYNYVGICSGSIIVFFLSRRYGKSFVLKMVGHKAYDKSMRFLKGKKFAATFALAIFLPFAPDDLLCYIAGLSDIEPKHYIAIILLGKPFSIFLYSLALIYIGNIILQHIKS